MNISLTPHITEKAYRTISEDKKEVSTYTFAVGGDADKAHIKAFVEKTYKVNVVDVRTINLPAKERRFKGKVGKTKAVIKALVRLQAGQRIAAFDIDEKSKQPAEQAA